MKKNLRLKLVLMYILSFICSLAPLVVCLILRWGNYIKAPSDAVKLSIGGVIVVIFIIMKVVGKLKMPSRVITFAIVFILSYLLEPLISDIMILSGMALLGEFVDYVLIQPFIKVIKQNILVGKTANATTQQVEEVIKKYIGGRV